MLPFTGCGVRRSTWVLSPTWPKLFWPQHQAAPVLLIPQLCSEPAASFAKPVTPLGTLTATGVWVLTSELSPSCPWLFHPQQYAAPALDSPQVWFPPAVRLEKPVTATGRTTAAGERLDASWLLPSC